MRHRPDWTSLVAASYDLRGSNPEWLGRVGRLAVPVLNGGAAPLAWAFSYTPGSFSLGHWSPACLPAVVRGPQSTLALPPEASLDLAHAAGYTHLVTRITDLLVIHCLDGAGSGVCIATLLANAATSTVHQRRRWARVAAHLGAAFRLRTLFHSLALDTGGATPCLDGCDKLHEVVRRRRPPLRRRRVQRSSLLRPAWPDAARAPGRRVGRAGQGRQGNRLPDRSDRGRRGQLRGAGAAETGPALAGRTGGVFRARRPAARVGRGRRRPGAPAGGVVPAAGPAYGGLPVAGRAGRRGAVDGRCELRRHRRAARNQPAHCGQSATVSLPQTGRTLARRTGRSPAATLLTRPWAWAWCVELTMDRRRATVLWFSQRGRFLDDKPLWLDSSTVFLDGYLGDLP